MVVTIVVYVIIWFICGAFAIDLQQRKGYEGMWWIAFLFGTIGLIYSAGLPDQRRKKIITENNKQTIETEDEEEIEDVVICKNCGNQIFEEETKCSNCGQKK